MRDGRWEEEKNRKEGNKKRRRRKKGGKAACAVLPPEPEPTRPLGPSCPSFVMHGPWAMDGPWPAPWAMVYPWPMGIPHTPWPMVANQWDSCCAACYSPGAPASGKAPAKVSGRPRLGALVLLPCCCWVSMMLGVLNSQRYPAALLSAQ